MSNNQPLVSIGIPVYNGERFIREALDSVLSQTFKDFELIISDNASTDRTEEICREYARQERRIRYSRQERNLGAGPNYNRVFALATGKYFKWAAHDDFFGPEYLEKCVAVLNSDPSVIWCHLNTIFVNENGSPLSFDVMKGRFVDSSGNLIRKHDPSRVLDSWKAHERYRDILLKTRWCFEIFGVIRTDALRQILQDKGYNRIELMGPYYGSDKVLLAELSLMGRYIEIPEPMFFRRCHSAQSSSMGMNQETKANWIASQNAPEKVASKTATIVAAKTKKPFKLSARILCLGGYLRAVVRAELSWNERALCLLELARWIAKLDNWQRFVLEVFREKVNIILPGKPL